MLVQVPKGYSFESKKEGPDLLTESFDVGGAYRIRTGDLYNANVAR